MAAYSVEICRMSNKTRSIIVTGNDEAYLATVADNYPLVSKHRVAQAAYRVGLRACVRCPDLVLEEARHAEIQDSSDTAASEGSVARVVQP